MELQQHQLTPATLTYEFPAAAGELLMHAFCVSDAKSVEVRSTMPSGFSYKALRSTFHSNTKMFQESDLTPSKKSIKNHSQCRGATYLQPSHDLYLEEEGFSYDGRTFALEILPAKATVPVTVCAMIPDAHWGMLTGGWTQALRDEGFEQDTFEDSGGMVWEVHCKELAATALLETSEK